MHEPARPSPPGELLAGWIDGQPVAHVAFSTRPGLIEACACRLVIMPEWQGAGVGLRFLNAVCQAWLEGRNRYRLSLRTLFHTSHPGLAGTLRRDDSWAQVSAVLHGGASRKVSYGGTSGLRRAFVTSVPVTSRCDKSSAKRCQNGRALTVL